MRLRCCAGATILIAFLLLGKGQTQENPKNNTIVEVISSSWNADRTETLIYLRVYSNGLAEAHPTRKVDFRHIELRTKQLSDKELDTLRSLLADPATAKIPHENSRYWGNKDFGSKYEITISRSSGDQKIELDNFQPFLARKEGKPYPKQVEKLGCAIWRLRAEVSGEPLEKNWLTGCSELGY